MRHRVTTGRVGGISANLVDFVEWRIVVWRAKIAGSEDHIDSTQSQLDTSPLRLDEIQPLLEMSSSFDVLSTAAKATDAKYNDPLVPTISVDKERNLPPHHASKALTAATAAEHSYNDMQAVKTYWRAFLW